MLSAGWSLKWLENIGQSMFKPLESSFQPAKQYIVAKINYDREMNAKRLG